jgi:hypothetical protein
LVGVGCWRRLLLLLGFGFGDSDEGWEFALVRECGAEGAAVVEEVVDEVAVRGW